MNTFRTIPSASPNSILHKKYVTLEIRTYDQRRNYVAGKTFVLAEEIKARRIERVLGALDMEGKAVCHANTLYPACKSELRRSGEKKGG